MMNTNPWGTRAIGTNRLERLMEGTAIGGCANNPSRRRSVTTINIGLCALLVLFFLASSPAVGSCKYSSILATAPATAFFDHGDGTVTDTRNGLNWMKCSLGQTWNPATDGCDGSASTFSWQQALEAADLQGFAGRNDWRIANIKEMGSIVEKACRDPSIDSSLFPSTPWDTPFWTSSPVAGNTTNAWSLDFAFGYSESAGPRTDRYYVRLVRGGRALSPLNDTGITWGADYPSGNNSDCMSTIGVPQDCDQGRDADPSAGDLDGHAGFIFTAIDAGGNPTTPGDHACVQDEVTGLMWGNRSDSTLKKHRITRQI